MINTQPEVSAFDSLGATLDGAFFFSASKSALRLFKVPFELLSEVTEFIPSKFVAALVEDSAFFPDILLIRILGTRVCNFCSRLRTRARISDTICTPLLRPAIALAELVLVVRASEVIRGAAAGRGEVTGSREGE